MRKFTLLIIIWLCVWKLDAQTIYPEVFATSGGSFQSASAHLTVTIGEPLYLTIGNDNNVLTQGFNQTMLVTYAATGVMVIPDLKLSVYPNPTVDVARLMVDNSQGLTLSAMISDMNGNILYRTWNVSSNTELSMVGYAAGTYILSVLYHNQIIKTFKIQKMN